MVGTTTLMADVMFVAIMIVLLGVSVLFIQACDRIIGADDDVVIDTADQDTDRDEAVAA